MAEQAPSAQTYAADLTRALADVSTPSGKSGLSFAGRGTADVLGLSIRGQTGLSLSAAAGMGASQITPVVNVAGDLLLSLARDIGGAAAAISNAVPLLGAVVGVAVIAATNSASGSGYDSNDPEVVRATCQADFRPVVHGSTLSTAGIVPADVFAVKGPGAPYEGYASTMGAVLEAVTERNPLVKSATRRETFRRLRRAMQGQYLVKGSDGGASVWPLYVDMLWAEWRSWPKDAWRTLYKLMNVEVYFPIRYSPEGEECKGSMEGHGAYTGCSCFHYERRGYDQVRALVDSWDSVVNPVYAQEQQASLDVQRMIDAARARYQVGGGGGTGLGGLLALGALGAGALAAYNPALARRAASYAADLARRARRSF